MEQDKAAQGPAERLKYTLAGLEIGRATAHRNLAVFPLTLFDQSSGQPGSRDDRPAYLSMEEAVAEGGFRVTELDASGSVPDLLATNDCGQPVLLVDGEQLVGAKQNRIINITILVAAKSSLKIPVSCVEAGRWSHSSADLAFENAPDAYFAEGRRQKARQVSRSMAGGRGRRSDQRMVWDAVAAKSDRLSASSATGDVRAGYRRHYGHIEDYVSAIAARPGQAGALFAIDGEPVGIELFGHPAPFGRLFAKLVRSYAIDAIETAQPAEAVPDIAQAHRFIEAVAAAPASAYPALGLGQDLRLESDEIDGGALLAEEGLVHLCAFRERAQADAVGASSGRGPSMQRPSERRRRHRSHRTLH